MFLHVAFTLMLAVGDVGAPVTTVRARRSPSPAIVRALMEVHHTMIVAQLVPGAIGSLATGLR